MVSMDPLPRRMVKILERLSLFHPKLAAACMSAVIELQRHNVFPTKYHLETYLEDELEDDGFLPEEDLWRPDTLQLYWGRSCGAIRLIHYIDGKEAEEHICYSYDGDRYSTCALWLESLIRAI